MILMKEYVSLTTAAMEISKRHFTVIIAAVAKGKRCFIGQFHVKSSRECHPYLMDFLKLFPVVGVIEI